MKILIGLGNPGEQYEMTRHNLGFMVLEQLLKDYASEKQTKWDNNAKLKSDIAMFDWQAKSGKVEKVVLVKPKTYMNNSGMALQLVANYYKVESFDIWVIHDDLDLPIGKLKIRFGGAAGGHHGVESILEQLGTDKFWRFRLGIGNPRHTVSKMDDEGEKMVISRRNMGDTTDFVLGEFVGKERTEIKKVIKSTVAALEVALEKDLETAMNQFNTK